MINKILNVMYVLFRYSLLYFLRDKMSMKNLIRSDKEWKMLLY